jgi:hypothetical protein
MSSIYNRYGNVYQGMCKSMFCQYREECSKHVCIAEKKDNERKALEDKCRFERWLSMEKMKTDQFKEQNQLFLDEAQKHINALNLLQPSSKSHTTKLPYEPDILSDGKCGVALMYWEKTSLGRTLQARIIKPNEDVVFAHKSKMIRYTPERGLCDADTHAPIESLRYYFAIASKDKESATLWNGRYECGGKILLYDVQHLRPITSSFNYRKY